MTCRKCLPRTSLATRAGLQEIAAIPSGQAPVRTMPKRWRSRQRPTPSAQASWPRLVARGHWTHRQHGRGERLFGILIPPVPRCTPRRLHLRRVGRYGRRGPAPPTARCPSATTGVGSFSGEGGSTTINPSSRPTTPTPRAVTSSAPGGLVWSGTGGISRSTRPSTADSAPPSPP